MIEMIIQPRDAKAGAMQVRRILPYRSRRMVGPFTFLDEMGPLQLSPSSTAGDVPAHPHIGLSTVTYLFSGEMHHRDSLGTDLIIRPGDLNWMTAGKGIVHSERIPRALREQNGALHGLQAWVALPLRVEDSEPSFQHFSREQLPSFEINRCQIHLIAGSAFGRSAPVTTESKLFYFEARLPAQQKLAFDPEDQEAAMYLLNGEVRLGETTVKAPALVVFKNNTPLEIESVATSHMVFLGGKALDGDRFIWWNFVSSSKSKIEDAKTQWSEQKFPAVPGETEFTPLPKI